MAPSPLARLVITAFTSPLLPFYIYTSFSPDAVPWKLAVLYLPAVAFATRLILWYNRWTTSRKAAKLGALVIPRVNGRFPLNLDILATFLRRFFVEQPGMYWDELFAEYGNTFDMGVFGTTTLMTKDPAVVKLLLTGDSFHNFEKGHWFNTIFADFLGQGIFNSDREMWKAHRAMNRPYFAKEKISDFETFARHTDHLLKVTSRLMASARSSPCNLNGAVDMQEVLGRYTLDAAIDFLMGGSLSSLSDLQPTETLLLTGELKSTEFLEAFNAVQKNCYLRTARGDLWPLWELTGSKNTRPMMVIGRLVDGLIEHALAKVYDPQEDSGTLLDHLIQETRDPRVLKDQVLNILLAARDTTQSTLSSSLYVLARHPEILQRLRSEILSTIGNEANPTYEAARGMRFLRAFINEVLRLFPPVPFNVRSSVGEDVFVSDDGKRYYVPAGVRITYTIFNIQRREDLWGKDALVFDPDRWLDARHSRYMSNPFIWTPFSAGARLCLGQNFALNQTSFALIRLLQRYDKISIAYDVQPEKSVFNKDELLLETQITLQFKGGLWVRLGAAEGEGEEGADEA